MVVRRTINTQNENVVPIVRAFILWQRRPLPARSLTPFFTLGRAQNASGAPAWTASVVLARPGELDLSRPRTRIDRRRGLPGFPLFVPAVAQQLAAGFEQSSCSSTATAITLTADPSRRWRAPQGWPPSVAYSYRTRRNIFRG